MKWLILAIFAEISVLLCLIFTFDGALHSLASARLFQNLEKAEKNLEAAEKRLAQHIASSAAEPKPA